MTEDAPAVLMGASIGFLITITIFSIAGHFKTCPAPTVQTLIVKHEIVKGQK